MTRLPALPFGVLLLLASSALAAPADSLAGRYRESLQALEENRVNEEKTRAERDQLAAEARELQEKLIANAAEVQDIEAAYADTQAELETLNQSLLQSESDLERDRGKVAQLLAVLQRLDADTPPALALKPEDSLAAARGAMQLGAVLPPLYAEAAALSKRLKTLEEVRNAQAAKAAQAVAEAAALRSARDELDRLLQLRNQEQATATVKLTELHGITEEISKTTVDLRGLMERIASLRAGSVAVPGTRIVAPERASADPPAKGSLRLPVVGKSEPGDPSGPRPASGAIRPSGLWFEGAPGTQAVAPSDSEVVFSGSYQNFGQVLILEMNGGYHLTLAGLGRIDVRIGDRVLAGEPIGVLTEGMPARLYLELRRNGQTVDPAPWMGAELRKAKGT